MPFHQTYAMAIPSSSVIGKVPQKSGLNYKTSFKPVNFACYREKEICQDRHWLDLIRNTVDMIRRQSTKTRIFRDQRDAHSPCKIANTYTRLRKL
jgi:hypothetical protein